ncbi:Transcriptional regulator HilA [Luteitalea pratensis]|uniref:Transcriptional regulator HilA n=1 Tax=Luteitalea pratensis TaxID=1855912 RepID=A0A143PMN4_LUTPR|nr:tetratricopeptide repeat protein [Luteitalea pratensis]AMY09473.1 Transcriptional regulator HilA [Luteitalea pratensis]
MASHVGGGPIRFGAFELDTTSGELRKRGVKVNLPQQAFRVLHALVERPGEVVSRGELQLRVWPDRTFVEFETGINKCVSQVRSLLGDTGAASRFIETLPKRGYRFVAPVHVEPSTPRTSGVVVLPFENLTGDATWSFVAEGVTDLITTALGEAGALRVIARTSARACAAADKGIAAVGRELLVSLAIEGAVVQLDAGTCLTVRIVDTVSERILWQRKYESGKDQVFTLCERIVADVGAKLQGSDDGAPGGRRLNGAATTAAQLAYLKGRYLWNRRSESDLLASLEEFRRALALEPDFALGHTGVAAANILLGIWGLLPSHTAFRMARHAAERALALNDGLAEAHTCIGEVLKDYDYEWERAELAYRHALTLNPSYSTAHHFLAQLLTSLGRHDEAIASMEAARSVDPLSPAINAYVPYIFLAARQYARAVSEGEAAVQLDPHSPAAHWQLGRACLFAGNEPRALDMLNATVAVGGRMPMFLAVLGFARARAGDTAGAQAILAELSERARTSYVSPYDFAVIYAGLGHTDAALRYLEHAYRDRVMRIISLGDPEFDDLRREPRFVALARQLRLPAATLRPL